PIPGSLLANLSPAQAGCSGTPTQIQACLNGTRATLEASRQAFDPLLTALENGGLPRHNIALMWPVKTLSISTDYVGIRAALIASGQVVSPDVSLKETIPGSALGLSDVAAVRLGCFRTPILIQGAQGHFSRDPQGNLRLTPA